MNQAEQWIQALGLQPHPEGGWFRELYRAEETISQNCLPERFGGDRQFSTAIFFLLNQNEVSAFHRIKQDELWHFYDGVPLQIHIIDHGGRYSVVELGRDVEAGQSLVAAVPAGCLFGASVSDPRSYGLVGCTVAPGFSFDDFEMPSRAELLDQFPKHREIIDKFTSC